MIHLVTRTLDYGVNSPFVGIFGSPRHLSWPVHAYRVTIPATVTRGQGGLNPFERVILNMIDATGDGDEHALANETCIPVDLVRSVVLKLRDRGLLDMDNRIIDRRRDAWESNRHEELYTSALVFRERVGGEVLPFVHVLDASNPIKTKDVSWKATTLNSATNRGAPSTREVIDAITEMKRRVDEHNHKARIPTIEQIRVEREPEEFLLDCQIAVQTRDADFRIADPFGLGFSRALENAFNERLQHDRGLQRWMTDWRHSLANPSAYHREQVKPRFSYDTPANRRRYPKLVETLTPAPGARHRSVTAMYAALEWALYYTCEARNPGIAIRQLNAETGPTYSQRLSEVAAGLGFEVPPFGFRPIPRGRFDDYRNNKSEMETVLALLQAESDDEHPMHTLARTHPDFIVRVRALARDRGKRVHGARVPLTVDTELDSDAFMRGAISTLLPAVRFEEGAQGTPDDSPADLLLDARASLLGTLGYQSFGKLGPDAQNSLMEAEKFYLVLNDGDDGREFLVNLYSALQGVLRRFLGGVAPIGLTERDYKKVAKERAKRARLGDLPPGIGSVNPRRIREALQGRDLSLGASVLALLLTASESRLASLARGQRTFLADVEVIHERRGHGNEPVAMSRAEAARLRKTAITTLATLLDLTSED